MKTRGADMKNMKDLWYQSSNEDIMKVFRVTLKSLGFAESDIDSTKLILDLVYERDDADFKVETETVANDPTTPPNSPVKSTDPEVQKILLFLQVQDDLDRPLKRVLRRAVTTAHTTMMAKQQADRTIIRFLNFKPDSAELCDNDMFSQDVEMINITDGDIQMVVNCGVENEDRGSGSELFTEAANHIHRTKINDCKVEPIDELLVGEDVKEYSEYESMFYWFHYFNYLYTNNAHCV